MNASVFYVIIENSFVKGEVKAMIKWFVFSGRAHIYFKHTASGLFFLLNQCVRVFCVICKIWPGNTFGNFLFASPSFISFNFVMWELLINQSQLSIQISSLEVHSFKSSWYTWECNNWHKLWKSTKLEILLSL